jgi:hypothetical protein
VNVSAAPLIVIGTAGQTVSYWSEGFLQIFSNTSFNVEVVVRGNAPPSITVRTVGGTVGELSYGVEHQPVFTKGQRSRLFLEPRDDGTYHVVGLAQGKQDAPPGVIAADPACGIPPAELPPTGGVVGPGSGQASRLFVLGAALALAAGAAVLLWRLRRT